MTQSIEDKFWSSVKKMPSGCWEWKRGRNRAGYGVFRYDGKNRGAHRIAYQLTHGDIPEGLFVCHHCDNPPCCNPDHLFVGSAKDNAQDMSNKYQMAQASEFKAIMNREHPEPKKVTVIIGKGRHTHTFDLELVGFEQSARLTPQLARQALFSVGKKTGVVWDTVPTDNHLVGYRVYTNAVRKLPTKDKRTTAPEGQS